MRNYRKILRTAKGQAMSRETGFHATNVGMFNLGEEIDPFIQFDHFRMARPVFGEHPHAGFSAVTLMFEDSENSFVNRDSLGGRELIRPGDTHWSQAGSGLVHDEVPEINGIPAHGVQMFINLPAAHKFAPPQALHLNAADTPVFTDEAGARLRVIAGAANGLISPLKPLTEINLLDMQLPANSEFVHEVVDGDSALAFLIKGSADFGVNLGAGEAVVFERAGNAVRVQTGADGAHYLFGSGKPLNEPIFSQGPFIMNTPEQMRETIARYRRGDFGQIAPS